MISETFWVLQDSDSAGNAALNPVSGAAPIQVTFVADDPDTGAVNDGDLNLEGTLDLGNNGKTLNVNGSTPDSNTVIVIDNVEYEVAVRTTGTLPFSTPGVNKLPEPWLSGNEVISFTVLNESSDGTTAGAETGNTYFLVKPDDGDGGPINFALLDGFGRSAINLENEGVPPSYVCFGSGTLIACEHEAIPIDRLEVGDLVMTKSGVAKPISWIGSRTVPAIGNLAPIVFQAGTIGNDRELVLSAQHRVLLTGWRLELLFGTDEALVKAKDLVNDTTITRREGGTVTYFHILLEGHDVLIANGAYAESLQIGSQSFNNFDRAEQRELEAVFPNLVQDIRENKTPVAFARSLKSSEAKVLVYA